MLVLNYLLFGEKIRAAIMEEKMEQFEKNSNDTEINLKEFIISIFIRWRLIFLISVVGMVVGGVFSLYKGYVYEKSINNVSKDQESATIYNSNNEFTVDSIREYLTNKGLSEGEVSDIIEVLYFVLDYDKICNTNFDYLNNSEFMKTNVIYLTEMKYMVEAEDEGSRENILAYYKNLLKSEEFFKYINDEMNLETAPEYLEEMIQLNNIMDAEYKTETDDNLNIYIYNSLKETSLKMADVVKNWITSQKANAVHNFGEHKLRVTYNTTYSRINSLYIDKKVKMYNEIMDGFMRAKNLKSSLSENESPYFEEIIDLIYNNVESDSEENQQLKASYNYRNNIVKYGIIGLVIGLLAGMCVVVLKVLYKDNLESGTELINLYGLNIFGGISVNEPKHRNFIDRALYKIRDKNDILLTDNDNYDMLVTSIKMVGENEKLRNILFTGKINSNSEKYLTVLIEKLKTNGINTELTKSVIDNAESLYQAGKADGVILIETLGESGLSDIEKEIYVLNSHNIKVLGTIVIH